MILKSYIVEQDVEVLNNYQATLIYGENAGIKDDIKNKIRKQNKHSEIITFFESDILKKKRYMKMLKINLCLQKRK